MLCLEANPAVLFRALLLLLSLTLTPVAPGLGSADAAPLPATGGIDRETADEIVEAWAWKMLETLPPDWRAAEREKWKTQPPNLGPHGLSQFMGPKGMIAFEHDPEGQRLLCWAVVHKVRKEYPTIGLTREEILDALERAAASGVDTGGGEVVYDPDSDGFFLLRVYDHPPKKTKKIVKEIDQLLDAGEQWFRGEYLEAVQAQARSMRPPASATARDGEFEVTLVLTPDKRYHDLWHNPPGGSQPKLVTRTEYERGEEVWAMALFKGASAGADGAARYQAQYSFVHPSGLEEGSHVFNFWNGPPPPADHLQMVEDRAAIEFRPDLQPGDYLARVQVCNAETGSCVMAVSPFRFTDDQGAGVPGGSTDRPHGDGRP